MEAAGFEALFQYGGFAVLAGCALYALWKSHETSLKHLDASHARESEALKLALQHITGSQTQLADLSKETVRALGDLCDEVEGLRTGLERKGLVAGRVLLLASLLFLYGCSFFPLPLGCSSTWFRSCSTAEPAAVPVPLSSAGEFQGDLFSFSWVVRQGVLLVAVVGLPEGRWRVQARRPGGWVVGEMEVLVPGGTSLTEIEIWPLPGKSIAPDAFPVFERVPAVGPQGQAKHLSSGGAGVWPTPLSLSGQRLEVADDGEMEMDGPADHLHQQVLAAALGLGIAKAGCGLAGLRPLDGEGDEAGPGYLGALDGDASAASVGYHVERDGVRLGWHTALAASEQVGVAHREVGIGKLARGERHVGRGDRLGRGNYRQGESDEQREQGLHVLSSLVRRAGRRPGAGKGEGRCATGPEDPVSSVSFPAPTPKPYHARGAA
jgi:hypothetical protein